MFKCLNVKITKAFTLIEVVVAVFIVTVGVLGSFSVIQQVITYTSNSSNRLIAAYLTQEGIEIARNIRDSNWLKDESWQTGLAGCEAQNGCEADYNSLNLSVYTGRYLKINSGFYNYDSGTDTKYKRKITITPDGADILKVLVSVEWQERGIVKRFSAQGNLYNWR